MSKNRVLIIDDSVVIRRLLADCLEEDVEIEVIGTAANGQIGIAKISQLNPDVVTLDIEMPVLDGLQTLAALRKVHARLPVIMFSTLTERGAVATLEALSLGASDYVTKPANVGSVSEGMQRIREQLVPKIKALCHREPVIPRAVIPPAASRPKNIFASASAPIEIVAIGVSTGGPNALAALLPELSKNFPVPVVIVQHMPALFTRLLAERLSVASGFLTREGEKNKLLRAGEIWVAPGGFHMDLKRTSDGVAINLHEGPPENSCRPAVDVLFNSVAKIYGARSLAVVLTGMGQDGLRGCQSISEAGGRILAQDEATSVVWGMPGAVTQAGLANKVLPLHALAAEINLLVRASAVRKEIAEPAALSIKLS